MTATDPEVASIVTYLHDRGIETTPEEVRRFLVGCRKHHKAAFGWELNESETIKQIHKGREIWVMCLHLWFGDAL